MNKQRENECANAMVRKFRIAVRQEEGCLP